MLIRESEEFIEKVLKNSSYHLAFNDMNDHEAQELNGICKNIMSDSEYDGVNTYEDAYQSYKQELEARWGDYSELEDSYGGRFDQPDDDFSYTNIFNLKNKEV